MNTVGRIGVLLGAVAALAVSGCSGSSSDGGKSGSKHFAIQALTSVPFSQAKDMMTGFKKGAAHCGLVGGQNVTYREDNAQGDQSTLQLLAKNEISRGADLLVALNTPAMVTQATQTKTIPIVAISPSYPVQAGVAKSMANPGGNVTGGTDTIDPQTTVDQVLKVLPNVKRLGMIYNSSEQNSVEFQKSIEPVFASRGVRLVQVTVANTGEIQTAVRGLVGRVDAFLIGHDNTMLSAAKTMIQLANVHKIPVGSSISGIAVDGAVFDLGVSYQFLGEKAGEQACQILLHGAKPGDLPFTTIKEPVVSVNPDAARKLGITIPADLLSSVEKVSTSN
jgi:putative ABC transport system substrate-binding protein